MQESFRRSTITLPFTGPLAASVGQVTYTSPRSQRIVSAQLCLSDSGLGAGATTVNLNVNGTAINAAGSLSIAGAAAGKSITTTIVKGLNNYPGGARLNKGDVVTADIAAIPATAPKSGFLVLDVVEVDV